MLQHPYNVRAGNSVYALSKQRLGGRSLYCRPVILGILFLFGLEIQAARGLDGARLFGVTQTSLSKAVPGGVLVVRAGVLNSEDASWQGTLVFRWPQQPEREVGRQIRLAPGKKILLEVPIEIPKELPKQKQFQLEVVLRNSAGQIVTLGDDPMIYTLPFTLDPQAPPLSIASALESPPPDYPFWYWPPPPDTEQESFEFAIATQIDAGNSRRSIGLENTGLPLRQEEWKPVDLLILSDPESLRNETAIQSAKHYVERGGRIWLQLDQLGCELVQKLLGDDQLCELIDVIPINEFVMEVQDGVSNFREEDRRVQPAREVQLHRIVQSGGIVTHSVDGWPAAVQFEVGYGEIIVTTLSGYGWLQPRTSSREKDPLKRSKYTLFDWGRQFAGNVAGVAGNPTALQQAPDYPLSRLGIPVIPRSSVLLALGGFCLALLLIGMWGYRRRSLLTLGLAIPTAAVGMALVMLMSRSLTQSDTSATFSRFQLIEISEGGNTAHVTEHAALYLESVTPVTLQSTGDGRAWPTSGEKVGIFRSEEQDFDHWSLSNQNWPAGTSRFQADYSLSCEGYVAKATLGQDGVYITLPQQRSAIEDAVVLFTPGNPMLAERVDTERMRLDGNIKVGQEKWIRDSLMSDEQRRRAEIYRQLFVDSHLKVRPVRKLFGWTAAWRELQCQPQLNEVGSALLSIPIELQRPEANSLVAIPHGLISLTQSRRQQGSTTAYDERTGRWQPQLTQAMDRQMVFKLPTEATPIQVNKLKLELAIAAPQRLVEITALTDEGDIPIVRLDNPSLPWGQSIVDPRILESFKNGTLELRLQISERDAKDSSQLVSWTVDYFHASVEGEVLAP